MQAYLTSNNMTTEQKQLLFQFRTRTYPCRTNYRKLYENDLSCQICLEEDSPEHLLACSRITAGIDITGVLISDIFGSTDQHIKIAKILKKITFNRNIILEQISQWLWKPWNKSLNDEQISQWWEPGASCVVPRMLFCILIWINIYI